MILQTGKELSSYDAILGPEWQKIHDYGMSIATVNSSLAYSLKP